jgi:hypothetical protein
MPTRARIDRHEQIGEFLRMVDNGALTGRLSSRYSETGRQIAASALNQYGSALNVRF